MGVNNRLKEIRMKEYLMTQQQFASEVLEMDYRQYNRYENQTEPKGATMLYIAKKLKKPVEQIFYLEE